MDANDSNFGFLKKKYNYIERELAMMPASES
jgi:hypothetical protein